MKKRKGLRESYKTHQRKKHINKSPKRRGEKTAVGTFLGTRRGFGFVRDESGRLSEDVFIPKHETKGALHGDTVRITYREKFPSGIEGRVTEIVEKSAKTVVGTLIGERVRGSRSYRRRYFLVPDSTHFPELLPLERCEAKEGDKIECAVERVRGEILLSFLRSFGPASTFFANRESLLSEMNIEREFEPGVEEEAERLAALPLSNEGRAIEEGPILTIDSESAKDLDDAVSLKKTTEGYLLSVHIADVSEYVRPKTALDRAAMKRGTSVYFADEVVPMLPEALSNGACSLNAGEDKYTLSAHISLDKQGRILKTRIEKGIISSDVRGVYSEVNDIFAHERKSKYAEKYNKVYKMLFLMKELYEILEKNARERGYLDFEAAEPYFLLDDMDTRKRSSAASAASRSALLSSLCSRQTRAWHDFLPKRAVLSFTACTRSRPPTSSPSSKNTFTFSASIPRPSRVSRFPRSPFPRCLPRQRKRGRQTLWRSRCSARCPRRATPKGEPTTSV